jgi:hypothetical protein
MHHRRQTNMRDLRLVKRATHEPVVLGDFVRLASGSPQGLVIAAENDRVTVAWLTGAGLRSDLPAVCVQPNASRFR